MISRKDRNVVRELASKLRDLAAQPCMEERKRLWKAVHDLRAERPVIQIETATIIGYVSPAELLSEDPYLRAVERNMRDTIRHAEEIGDDIVVEPYYRIGWQLDVSDFGVPVEVRPTTTPQGDTGLGYSFNFPVARPADIAKLKKRTFAVNREKTASFRAVLDDIMGDILPVRVGNYDPFLVDPGDEGWTGLYFFGLTWQIYRLIGNNGLLYWLYDSPETIHWLMRYMLDDRVALFQFLEREGLLVANTDNQMAGPRSFGYVSGLPAPADDGQGGCGQEGGSADRVQGGVKGGRGQGGVPDAPGRVTLKDLWGWAESQETTIISPAMYKEFFLPYLARLSERFGLIYYGCCEPVDDRLELIIEAIPNLRSVSVSGWANFEKVAGIMGKKYVFSRKPTPAYISGQNPDWSLVEKDMRKTYNAAKDCNVEILFRDIYTVDGDRPRLAKWVEMTKSIFGI